MKKVIILLGILLVAGGLVFAYKHRAEAPTTLPTATSTPSETMGLKDTAWQVFQKYLLALKTHDLKEVKALSYQTSDTCVDPAQEAACFKKMDTLYTTIKDFKESDFSHVVSDAKQIIMYSDWAIKQNDLVYAETRKVMYFTRKPDGTPQILFMTQPIAEVYTLKAKGETAADWDKELAPRIKDSDGDTLEDEVETCSYPNAPTTCVKTDPNKKDTDGDGYWDSTQQWFFTQ